MEKPKSWSREDMEKTMSSSSRSPGSRTETEVSGEKRSETGESSNGFFGSRLEVKRQETVVTNEKEVARLIKLVRPRWKRADLILQVSSNLAFFDQLVGKLSPGPI